MATTIQVTFTPDSSLGLSTETRTLSLSDPLAYQALLTAYTAILGLGASTHAQFIDAFVKAFQVEVQTVVENWVQTQKIASVKTSLAGTITIS